LPQLRLAPLRSPLPGPSIRHSGSLGARTGPGLGSRPAFGQPLGFRSRMPLQPQGPRAPTGAPLNCQSIMYPLQYPERMPSEEAPVTGEPAQEKTPWQRVQNARHPKRPHTLDYVQRILTDFQEIHGDRLFGDDPAIVCGMARLDGRPVLLVGEQKGRDTKQKLYRNFGMPKPEGYRKALRAMQLANKFGRPIITFL